MRYLVVSALLLINTAQAEPLALNCSGDLYYFQPNNWDATAATKVEGSLVVKVDVALRSLEVQEMPRFGTRTMVLKVTDGAYKGMLPIHASVQGTVIDRVEFIADRLTGAGLLAVYPEDEPGRGKVLYYGKCAPMQQKF